MEVQAFYDSVVVFFVSFFSLQYGGGQIFDPETGQTADHWAASVTCFTALVLVVHFNLLTRMHHFTILHMAVVTFGASFIYLLYMWVGNYADYSQTQHVVLKLHKTFIFYLVIACCLAWSFSLDLAVECYRVLIRQTPSDFLRSKVAQRQPLDELSYAQFKQLVNREEKNADLKRDQERSVSDLRQTEFLRLRRSSMESMARSSGSIPRPSGSREDSRVQPQ